MIFDPSFLALPLFDDHHRALAARLEEWVEKNGVTPSEFEEGDIALHIRGLAKTLSEAGWMRYAVGELDHEPIVPDLRSLCLTRMALAFGHDLYDFVFSIQSLAAYAIVRYGTIDQRQKYVRGIRSGDLLGALAITEPQTGSNVAGIALAATGEGDERLLTGEKAWIGNGDIADFSCVLARDSNGPAPFAMSLYIVPADSPGLTRRRHRLLAPRPFASLKFDNSPVSTEARVGKQGHGYRYALEILERYRATVGAAACGFAARAFREAVEHSRRRRIGDELLIDLQMTKDRLASMRIDLDASLLFWARAAWAFDTGCSTDIARHASAAKFVGTEGAQRIVDSAVQLFGATGLVVGSWTEALYRQVRLLRIYEGTSEIQKLIIAKSIQ